MLMTFIFVLCFASAAQSSRSPINDERLDPLERLTSVFSKRVQRFIETTAENVPHLLVRERNQILGVGLSLRERITDLLILPEDENQGLSIALMLQYTHLANRFNQIVRRLERARIPIRNSSPFPFYDGIEQNRVLPFRTSRGYLVPKLERIRPLPLEMNDILRTSLAKTMSAVGYLSSPLTADFIMKANGRNFAIASKLVRARAGLGENRNDGFQLQPTGVLIKSLEKSQAATTNQIELIVTLLENGYWVREDMGEGQYRFEPSFSLEPILAMSNAEAFQQEMRMREIGPVENGTVPDFLPKIDRCEDLFNQEE